MAGKQKAKKGGKKKRARPRNDDNKSTMTDITVLTEKPLILDNGKEF